MLTSINEFILAVEDRKDIADAYDIFEMNCTDSLRSEIYLFADPASSEPFRSAMHNLGFDSY